MSEESRVRPGIYKIAVWRDDVGPEPLVLTALEGGGVTVEKLNPEKAREQQWSVGPATDGNLAIQIPAHLFPSRSLSYRAPERGERIILGRVSDFPTREWVIDTAPQRPYPVPYFIRVPDRELIVAISPITIFPPQLHLEASSIDLENAWALIPVGGEE